MSTFVKNVLCLTLITIVAGFGLGYVYDVTKEPIAQMEENTKLSAYKSVLPDAASFSESDDKEFTSSVAGCDIDSVVTGIDASGTVTGYVINVTSHDGYGGDITISMGIDKDGCVRGVEFLKIGETAGLGMKAKDAKFKDQFKDKTVAQFTYTKNGATSDFEIDAISGATITTKAVTNAVNAGLGCFNSLGGGAE